MATVVFAKGYTVVTAAVLAVERRWVVVGTVALGVGALVRAVDGTALLVLSVAFEIVTLSILANRTPKSSSSLQQRSSDETDIRKMHRG